MIPQFDSPHQMPFSPDFPAAFDSPPLWWGFGRKWGGAGAVGGSKAHSGFRSELKVKKRSRRCGWPPADPTCSGIFVLRIRCSEFGPSARRRLLVVVPHSVLLLPPPSTRTSGAICSIRAAHSAARVRPEKVCRTRLMGLALRRGWAHISSCVIAVPWNKEAALVCTS